MATTPFDHRPPRRLFKRGSAIRRPARWSRNSSTLATRDDALSLSRWERAAAAATTADGSPPYDKFAPYNIQVEAPNYDDEVYEKNLKDDSWTKEETDHLVEVYRECNGKWPVIVDHYSHGIERSMEDLKSRFYSISATMLQIATPISSMTASEYARYEILKGFDPKDEANRKQLAEGHLYRRTNEVDEETVLLGELQRIMLNQATLDSEREELRRRLDYPHAASNGYQYATSTQLNGLWQNLLRQDQMRKISRLKATGNPNYDGITSATPTSARSRESNAGLPDSAGTSGRRPTRDSLPAIAPQSGLPSDLSKADLLKYGVVVQQERMSSGVSFASDKLSKPRIAKSTIQTEKIAAILLHIGVPEIIPLPTSAVIDQFETIMSKVHTLLEMRKVAEKEEQELRVRQAEATTAASAT